MDAHLAPAFGWLRGLGAAVCHYKVCSTFDSAPETGNIGRAIEIGRRVFGQATVPLIVGAPQLRRYTAFGNLFAAYRGATIRIDRHPVMSRHPVSPMHEADLLVHLSRPDGAAPGLARPGRSRRLRSRGADGSARSRSGHAAHRRGGPADAAAGRRRALAAIAAAAAPSWRLIRRGICPARRSGRIGLGREQGRISAPLRRPTGSPSSPAACSPTTERQIRLAGGQGFEACRRPGRAGPASARSSRSRRRSRAGRRPCSGRSVILYTALGPRPTAAPRSTAARTAAMPRPRAWAKSFSALAIGPS